MQAGSGVFDLGAAVAVNNAAFAALVLHEAPQLIERFKLLHQRVTDIGAVEAADLDQRLV
ncbi:hypothetical protein D3C78_1498600 [compost metagenome]